MAIDIPIRQRKSPEHSAIEIDREEILRHYHRTRKMTEWICAPLTTEDCVIQTGLECSPVKWQLAHTTWFFETFVLIPNDPSYTEFHPKFSYLFNSYYNAVGERTPRDIRGLMSRPTLAEVWNYRQHVDEAIEHFLRSASEPALAAVLPIIELGINHEQQHQELMLTDVKTVLAMNPLRPIYREREIASSTPQPLHWISHDEGLFEFGASKGEGFFFDNEGPRHRQYLERVRTRGPARLRMASIRNL